MYETTKFLMTITRTIEIGKIFLDKQNSNSHVAMDVGERCFNLDFVIKFMRGEL